MRRPAFLFDLDGTLVDSAPDLAGAGNAVRLARGLPERPLSDYRPHTSAASSQWNSRVGRSQTRIARMSPGVVMRADVVDRTRCQR